MDTIGKYEVREKVGSGGFGVVYRAYDPFIRREVAIKTLTSDDDETRHRFANEARIAGNLQHRNITTVYDYGLHEGFPYLVQEYLSGEDLDRKIRRKEPISFPEKLLYLIQIARGLAYAHDQGVIHRDIKPANIRVLEDGTTKILDFGIARLAQQETRLTKTGLTVGTAAYLAPEQVTGDPVDRRTDIFSYGVLAYELLTYERPFPGPKITNVLLQIANEPHVPVRRWWPECPEGAVRVVDRCLSKDPTDRFQDCHALLLHLDRLLDESLHRDPTSQSGQASANRPATGPEGRTVILDTDSGEVILEPTAPVPQQAREATPPPVAPQPPAPPLPEPVPEPLPEPAYTLPVTPIASPTPPARPRRPSASLDDLDLSLNDTAWRPGPRGGSGERSSLPWILTAILAIALAAGVGWQLGQGRLPGEVAEPGEATTAKTPVPPPPETTEVEPAPSSAATAPRPDSAEAAATPEDEPPPPAPATVSIPAAWGPGMTVEVAGKRFDLARPRSVELPAGEHRFVFSYYDGAGYRARQTVKVSLTAGEDRAIGIPIRPPGQLRIFAALGTPQGAVVVDGEDRGMSPVTLTLSPGRHRIAISGPGASSKSAEVELPPGGSAVVTFDLDSDLSPRIVVPGG